MTSASTARVRDLHRPLVVTIVVVVVAVAASGCTLSSPPSDALDSLDALPGSEVSAPRPAAAPATTASETMPPLSTTTPRRPPCVSDGDATLSYHPTPLEPDEFPAGSSMAAIRDAGVLRVGVDENTLGFSSREAGQLEGFEVDLAREIAARLFGDRSAGRVELVPVNPGEKVRFVQEGAVDLTIDAITMDCGRWEQVAFSAEYFTAHQEFLVRRDSDIRSRDDLPGRKVCVPEGSSSARILRDEEPDVELVEVGERTDCLVALQEGEAEAYFAHDSFLYGMLVQDPTLEVREGILPPERTVTHYGIAVAHERHDLVGFVNAVLEELVDDGTWDRLRHALEDRIGLPYAPAPEPRYWD